MSIHDRKTAAALMAALSVSAISAFAADAVYLKPLAEGEERAVTDGSSWASAYSDAAAAMDAAQAAGKPVYAAQGVYIISSGYTVTGDLALYGGFPGESDGETLSDRDWDEYQTIFTGDKNSNDVWVHIEPATNSISVAKGTNTTEPVVANGKVNVPAFTADYDYYILKADYYNTANCFVLDNGSSATIDGIWMTGFSSGNNGVGVLIRKVTGANIRNCRFVAIRTGHGVICDDGSNTRTSTSPVSIINCRFLGCYESSRASGIASRTAMTVSDCEFVGGGNGTDANMNGGACIYLWAGGTAQFTRCTFSRIAAYNSTAWLETGYGGNGAIISSEGGWGVFRDCVFSNCFAASSQPGSAGNSGGASLSNARNVEFSGCFFTNNMHRFKAVAGQSYVSFRSNGQYNQIYAGCTFAGNRIYAEADPSSEPGECTVGLVGNNITGGAKFSFINTTFSGNSVEAVESDNLRIVKSRGIALTTKTTGTPCAVGIANCTFTGADAPETYDVLQYGDKHSQQLNIVNTIFTSDADFREYNRFDNPSVVQFESVSVKNAVLPQQGVTSSNYEYDEVPLSSLELAPGAVVPVCRPNAAPPGIRVTADVATNAVNTMSGSTTFRYKPVDGEWKPLIPAMAVSASVDDDRYIPDAESAARPAGSFTRGAVQAMTDVAENGVTLTVRRDPITAGSLSGPAVQAVAAGAPLAPVTAIPAEGSSFVGWHYPDSEEILSAETAQPLAALAESKVIVAEFGVPPVAVIFNLGSYGTFDDSGLATVSVMVVPGKPFPEIPPYTISPEWYQIGWDAEFPTLVPNSSISFNATAVTTDVRIIRVVPSAEAGENQDGLSWETAYGSIDAAMADAGLCRGEIWIKEGLYLLKKSIDWLPNVSVRGGFAGNETSADQADPAAHPTIISGDTGLDSYWKPDNTNPAAANRVNVYENGSFNIPDFTDGTKYYTASGASSDIYYGFLMDGGTLADCEFTGLTFYGFYVSAIYSNTRSDANVTIRNCRFIGCNTSQNNERAVVYLEGNSVDIRDSEFFGCNHGVFVTGENRAITRTNVVSNCTFTSISSASRGGALYFINNQKVDVRDSVFEHSYGSSEAWRCAPTIGMQGSVSGTVSDCVFRNNYIDGNCHGVANLNGNTFTVTRCIFTGNRMESSSDRTVHSAGLTVMSGYALVRDSFFGNNKMTTGSATANSGWASAFCAGGGSSTLLNCTFDGNEAVSTSTSASTLCGTIISSGGNLAIVNCAVTGSAFSGATSEIGITSNLGSGYTFTIMNTIVDNDAAGYVPVVAPVAAQFGIANSYIAGFNKNSVSHDPDLSAYVYNLYTEKPRFVPGLATGADGKVPHRRLVSSSPYRNAGRPVWLDESSVYFYDNESASSASWRGVQSRAVFYPSVGDLTLESPLIPDAYGNDRVTGKVPLGPVNPSQAGLSVIVR